MQPAATSVVIGGDISAIHRLEVDEYGASYDLPSDQLAAWAAKYPKGLISLIDAGELAGAIGLWPISSTCYDGIVAGCRSESTIMPADVSSSITPYWYFGDIILKHDWRKRRALYDLFLLDRALKCWTEEPTLPETVHFCAFAFTKSGTGYLKRFQFQHVADAPDMHPVFARSMKVADVWAIAEEARTRRNRCISRFSRGDALQQT